MNLFLFFFFSLVAEARPPELTKIVTLNETEAYAPMVLHNQQLWLGRVDHSNRKSVYSIEIRTPDGETVLSKKLMPHSVERLYPFDKERILVTGKAFTSAGWVTYYSLVRSCCGAVGVETYPVATTYQVEEFARTPENLFFNEPSERSILTKTATGLSLLPIEISGPGQLQVVGNFLWVLERQSFFLGDENLVRIDLKTMKVERVFSDSRDGLMNVVALKDGTAVATAEYRKEQVILVDSVNPSKQIEVSIPGTHPRAIAEWGRCLIVASEYPHRLSVLKRTQLAPQIIHELDLVEYQSELPNLHTMAVEPKTGSLFLRSAVVSGDTSPTQNSVYRVGSSPWSSDCQSE